jgi:hypothetical protein
MSYIQYDSNHDFFSKLLEYRLYLLSTINKLIKAVHFPSLKTGFFTTNIAKANKRLGSTLLLIEGLKTQIKDYNKEQAVETYPTVQDALKHFRTNIYQRLAADNFFDNLQTQEICDNIFSNLYDIEASLRNLAYTDVDTFEDVSLQEFASNLSLSSIPA